MQGNQGAEGYAVRHESRVDQSLTMRLRAGHSERIGGVAWHPEATLSQSATAVNFATSGADNVIKLWGLEK